MNGTSAIGDSRDGSGRHHNDLDRIDDDSLDDHNDDDDDMLHGNDVNRSGNGFVSCIMAIIQDFWYSSGLVLNNKLNWLLVLGPIALVGDAMGWLGETACFAFSGLALIPCAERYVYISMQ